VKVFCYCVLAFSIAWLIHLLIWRTAQPKRHTRALLIIFTITLAVTLLVSYVSIYTLTEIQIIQLLIFYIPTMLAYICFYSAIEENSPSISLIALTEAKKACQFEDYFTVFNNQILVDSRLSAMTRDGLLKQNGQYYQPTPKGLFLGRLFTIASQCLRLRTGG
jgi:hypothetical protein